MDRFGFSLLPAATRAGLDATTISRHVPLFRRDVGRQDVTLAIAQCTEPNRYIQNDLVLLLTQQRLVVTRRTRLLDRVRPHLSAGLDELTDVRWQPRSRQWLIDLTFVLHGRPRQLWVHAPYPGQLDGLVTAFHQALPVRLRAC